MGIKLEDPFHTAQTGAAAAALSTVSLFIEFVMQKLSFSHAPRTAAAHGESIQYVRHAQKCLGPTSLRQRIFPWSTWWPTIVHLSLRAVTLLIVALTCKLKPRIPKPVVPVIGQPRPSPHEMPEVEGFVEGAPFVGVKKKKT